MGLSQKEIDEDLKEASSDDVAFDKDTYYKITGKTEKKLPETDVTKSYNDVKEYLGNEEQLGTMVKDLKTKQEKLLEMKKKLKVALQSLETDKKQLKS